MIYFSDKYENDEFVPTVVWNGVVVLYKELVAGNYFAQAFPETCPDNGMICSVNIQNLEHAIKAIIPSISLPIHTKSDKSPDPFSSKPNLKQEIELSTLIDFIEFIFNHLANPEKIGSLHQFYNHFHLQFDTDNTEIRSYFTEKVNDIFRRNALPYAINQNGSVERIVDEIMMQLIEKETYCTRDLKLNQLLNSAYKKFKSPKSEERREALDTLWDAYEQLKTHYGANEKVKQSIESIVRSVSFDSDLMFETISQDAEKLYSVGNKADIRHKNTEVESITHSDHVDYLFFRMSSLMQLLLTHFDAQNETSI
ncbi:MAG: hypothetical protein Q7T91_00475 [Sulfuricurvum sp.]|nr:hypothetical protein [Sulfuricurvum sp.]